MDKNTFSKVFSEARKNKRITIKELADICGVSTSAINRYMAGKSYPTLEIAVRMAKAVDVSIDKIFGLHNDDSQLADAFLLISDLMMTKGDYLYLADFDQERKTIFITPETFHGAIDFESWEKLVVLYRRNIVPKEMYDAWVEKKSDSLRDFKLRKDDNR